ncbi:MAG: glutathione peroxidase [Planctomycetes bacterium]|nr:glutathione peroxidase [Planctomycetota bacterium]MBI3835068.1 glutathione peroxidase [Planctomycetota bacterium]
MGSKILLLIGSITMTTLIAVADDAKPAKNDAAGSIYDFKVKSIDGKEVALSQYKGDVFLIVNVASQCGLTEKSYPALEAVYEKFKDKGFKILAFPANNFGKQEPGTDPEIKEFCAKKNVKFELFSKISVKGDDQAPLYKFLTKNPNSAIAGDVEWNFQKYLIGRDGKVIAKFGPKTMPDDKSVTEAIEKALAERKP